MSCCSCVMANVWYTSCCKSLALQGSLSSGRYSTDGQTSVRFSRAHATPPPSSPSCTLAADPTELSSAQSARRAARRDDSFRPYADPAEPLSEPDAV